MSSSIEVEDLVVFTRMGWRHVARLEEEHRKLKKPEQMRDWARNLRKAASATVATLSSSWSYSCKSLPDEQQLARLERQHAPISLVQLYGLSERHVRQYLLLLSTRSSLGAGLCVRGLG